MTDKDVTFDKDNSPKLATVYAKYYKIDPCIVNRIIITHLTIYTSEAGLKITPMIPGEQPVAALERTAEELFTYYPYWTVKEMIYFIHEMKNGAYKQSEWYYNHANVIISAKMFNQVRMQEEQALIERRESVKKAAESKQHALEVELSRREWETRSMEVFERHYDDLSLEEQHAIRQSCWQNPPKGV